MSASPRRDTPISKPIDHDTPLVAALTPLPVFAELEKIWRDLEARADGSFFTSWTWIGAWIEALARSGAARELALISVRDQLTIVGLGIICPGPRRWRSLGRRLMYLHQTGRAPFDSIYIEYNDFLVDVACATAARAACISRIASSFRFPFRVSAGVPQLIEAIASTPHRLTRVENCAYVDLTQIAPLGTDGNSGIPAPPREYIANLSRNARAQIRRSQRIAEAEGPMRLTRADSAVAAAAALKAMSELHTLAWTQRKGLPGAFATPFFAEFIARLVEAGCDTGAVDLLHIETPKQTLGFLLNFLYRGEVYAYQSAFTYSDDNRFKPGLVSHALAINFYRQMGFKGYHFMAGGDRYKRTLSNAGEILTWAEIRPEDFFSRVEDYCEALWHMLRPNRAPSNAMRVL